MPVPGAGLRFSDLPEHLRLDAVAVSWIEQAAGPAGLPGVRFHRIDVEIADLEQWTAEPEAFLEADDGEEQFDRVLAMVDAYERHGPGALPPVIVTSSWSGSLEVLDGMHRLSAARAAGLTRLPALDVRRA